MSLLPQRRRRRIPPAAALAGGAAAAGAVAAGAVLLRRRAGDPAAGDGPAPVTSDGQRPPEPWTCVCGQAFRVNGEGRHRVLWLPDAPPEEPLLEDRCPNCERSLAEQA